MAPLFKLAIILCLSLGISAQGTKKLVSVPCKSDAECDQGCCAFNTGLCAGPVIAQTRDGGCGFGDPQPNRIAADEFFRKNGIPVPAPAATP